ncbi:MAG: 50S ribosomal protein L24 [candidate division WS6 bacterium OLB20]|uniref:Large ribosomal subunit protein uL24 n=1 Tax=candidate division WS6 bacterium OLB20 TaxID=1617426 RepID=A0A136LX09_9BACT|nr:MAG: 50S ribosomal protein L24 [candidate division WS6 bacterium OLB20]
MKIKKGDTVQVITGKDRGKTGKVLRVFRLTDRVVVEGVNIQKRHRKATNQNEQSGIVSFEGPIHVSNVMIVDPKDNKPSRIGYTIEKGEKTRVSKRSGSKI